MNMLSDEEVRIENQPQNTIGSHWLNVPAASSYGTTKQMDRINESKILAPVAGIYITIQIRMNYMRRVYARANSHR